MLCYMHVVYSFLYNACCVVCASRREHSQLFRGLPGVLRIAIVSHTPPKNK